MMEACMDLLQRFKLVLLMCTDVVGNAEVEGLEKLYPCRFEDLGGILATTEGYEEVGLVVHQQLCCLDPGTSRALCRTVDKKRILQCLCIEEAVEGSASKGYAYGRIEALFV
jgi:hypothetical protein